jgi:hypothetical protein
MNWIEFLEAYDVEYVTRGPNTKKGEISITCPFCGDGDPSQHMGVAPTKELWGCMRNSGHRGRAPEILVKAILSCSLAQAKLIVEQYSRADPNNLDEAIKVLEGNVSELPSDYETYPQTSPITNSRLTSRFYRYLIHRHFEDPSRLTGLYGVQLCLKGRFKDRIIIPLFQNEEILAWTGRALGKPKNAPRYLSSKRVKETVFNEDELRNGGEILVIAEGPFDALKLDYYGRPYGIRATCLFGITPTISQYSILNSMKHRWRKVFIVFDPGAIEQEWEVSNWLGVAQPLFVEYEKYSAEDLGDMTKDQIYDFCKELRTSVNFS